MVWSEAYTSGTRPSMSQITGYIRSQYWEDLCSFIEENYKSAPSIEYSGCSMRNGWNVKYRKGSRAICTLYPAEGYFTCMVSVGRKEAGEAELLLTSCTPYVQKLYADTKLYNGGRWLMIDVKDNEILEDVKDLISVRMGKSL